MTDDFDKGRRGREADRDKRVEPFGGGDVSVRFKPGWTGWVTMVFSVLALVAATFAAGYAWTLNTTNALAISGGVKPAYQAVCLVYSDFVLTQAHNGYTPEQIQRVIDFAGSHQVIPDRDGPERFSMPNRWPSISDEKACGTPAQVIEHAR